MTHVMCRVMEFGIAAPYTLRIVFGRPQPPTIPEHAEIE
jgi:hypothetical protein